MPSASRAIILHAWQPETLTPQDRAKASSLAGGFTGGTIGGLIRGRANIIPGTIMFTLFGYLGQTLYNTLDARHTHETMLASTTGVAEKKNWMERMAEMKWSPMKVLSDEQYERMLRERLLKVEAEIAILDEKIESVGLEVSNVRSNDSQVDQAGKSI